MSLFSDFTMSVRLHRSDRSEECRAQPEVKLFFFYFIPAGRRIGSLAIRAEVEFRFGGQVESCLFAKAKGRAADCRWKADAGRGASSLLAVLLAGGSCSAVATEKVAVPSDGLPWCTRAEDGAPRHKKQNKPAQRQEMQIRPQCQVNNYIFL